MAVNVEIFRGNQIGGCVTVIDTEQGSIMIDYGTVLPGSSGADDADGARLERLLSATPPRAVFFTHYHGDHAGRFADLAAREADGRPIPLYMGATCARVLKNIHMARKYCDEHLSDPPVVPSPHTRALKLLEAEQMHTFQDGAVIRDIPGFTVEPILVDHSAFDAYMFLITAPDGTRILHTGDFRGHGHLGARVDVVEKLRSVIGGRTVDILITEGTMMSRQSEALYSERRLYEDAQRLFSQHRHVFLAVSSTNPDSIGSFSRAAREQGIPLYCPGKYVQKQLKTFRKAAAGADSFYDFDDVRSLWRREEEMRRGGFLAIVQMNDTYLEWIRRFANLTPPPVFVYSMWRGYLDGAPAVQQQEWRRFRNAIIRDLGADGFRVMHTGGHADAATLARLIRSVAPVREIIPIHTENAAGFLDLEIGNALREKLRLPEKLTERRARQAGLSPFRDQLDAALHQKRAAALQEYPDAPRPEAPHAAPSENSAAFHEKLPEQILFSPGAAGEIRMELTGAAAGLPDRALGETALNMQTDPAAFEAWALILKTYGLAEKLLLSVEKTEFPPPDLLLQAPSCDGFGHYFRFLYRVMQFRRQFGDWFCIDAADTALQNAVERFSALIYAGHPGFCGNRPARDAAQAQPADGAGREKNIEQRFAGVRGEPGPWEGVLLEAVKKALGAASVPMTGLHAQLPVGLFRNLGSTVLHSIQAQNRVFTGSSSAIDLWGIAGDELVLFELKQGNRSKAGIVTELMFYANYLRDLFVADNSWTPAPHVKRSDWAQRGDRGYHELFVSPTQPRTFRLVRAFMLADRYHPLLDTPGYSVLSLMNQNSASVRYGRLIYSQGGDGGVCSVDVRE